ncbi:MAG: flavodoxin family protein [Cyanobacteria bacterium J069]|nr:MAG: flavodoxin family protein [Cyanobacteria bacterium J069]
MPTVAIVYFSGSGHTKLMAEAVAAGASQVSNTEVKVLPLTGEQIVNGRWQDAATLDALNAADAIIFGSPTYMGGVAAQFKAFIDAASSVWAQQGWKDKIAGGFTHSGSPSGDKQGTLLYLAINAAQHSMVWVGNSEMGYNDLGVNRLGSFLGVMGFTVPDFSGQTPATLDEGDRLTSERYGRRIAEAVQRWKG